MFFAALIVSVITFMVAGCGVPKAEHEKIVKELQKANEEKATISAERDRLSQQVTQLQAQIDTLRKENEGLKAKLAPKKQAITKTPAKATTKKKK